MAIFTPAQLDFSDEKFSMIVYGAPGVGKTTIASSAPNPIVIDLDKGIRRVKAEHRPVFSRVNTYEELMADLQSPEFQQFETIVIDTGGALISLLQEYVMRKDPVNKTKGGTISQKGFGAVKAEFVRLINWLKTSLNKNIIFVFHAVEEKNKDGAAVQRLLCEGSAKNIVWQPCDFGAYLFKNGDKTVAAFSPTDEYFAKGCYGITGIMEVPFGDGVKNDFLTRLFEKANKTLAEESEFFKEEKATYDEAMEKGKELIEAIDTPDKAMKVGEDIKKLHHSLTSLAELRQIWKDKIKSLGYVWNSEKKAYVATEKPKEDKDEETPETPTEKPKKAIKKAGKGVSEQQTLADTIETAEEA